jgi:hypothetical protein
MIGAIDDLKRIVTQLDKWCTLVSLSIA